jgi:hypothetical protein
MGVGELAKTPGRIRAFAPGEVAPVGEVQELVGHRFIMAEPAPMPHRRVL